MLDASALLAMVFAEAGASRVEDTMTGALVSTVNLTEVVGRMIDAGYSETEARVRLGTFDLSYRPFDYRQALDAGLLRQATRGRGLSLGDRACIALARREGVRVLTADRAWAGLDLGVEIEVIR